MSTLRVCFVALLFALICNSAQSLILRRSAVFNDLGFNPEQDAVADVSKNDVSKHEVKMLNARRHVSENEIKKQGMKHGSMQDMDDGSADEEHDVEASKTESTDDAILGDAEIDEPASKIEEDAMNEELSSMEASYNEQVPEVMDDVSEEGEADVQDKAMGRKDIVHDTHSDTINGTAHDVQSTSHQNDSDLTKALAKKTLTKYEETGAKPLLKTHGKVPESGYPEDPKRLAKEPVKKHKDTGAKPLLKTHGKVPEIGHPKDAKRLVKEPVKKHEEAIVKKLLNDHGALKALKEGFASGKGPKPKAASPANDDTKEIHYHFHFHTVPEAASDEHSGSHSDAQKSSVDRAEARVKEAASDDVVHVKNGSSHGDGIGKAPVEQQSTQLVHDDSQAKHENISSDSKVKLQHNATDEASSGERKIQKTATEEEKSNTTGQRTNGTVNGSAESDVWGDDVSWMMRENPYEVTAKKAEAMTNMHIQNSAEQNGEDSGEESTDDEDSSDDERQQDDEKDNDAVDEETDGETDSTEKSDDDSDEQSTEELGSSGEDTSSLLQRRPYDMIEDDAADEADTVDSDGADDRYEDEESFLQIKSDDLMVDDDSMVSADGEEANDPEVELGNEMDALAKVVTAENTDDSSSDADDDAGDGSEFEDVNAPDDF